MDTASIALGQCV